MGSALPHPATDPARPDAARRITGTYPPPLTDRSTGTSPRHRARARAPHPPHERLARTLTVAAVLLAAATVGALQPHEEPARDTTPMSVAVPVPASTAPASTAPPGQPTPVPPGEPAPAPVSTEPVLVRIPALDTASPVVRLGLQHDGTMEVPAGAEPVGWYAASPTPGELGPAVLTAHVDWEGRPGAFAGLDELRAGDVVAVDRADATTATFSVDRVIEPSKTDFPTVEVYGDIHHAGLRLITCGGDYDEATGDYEHNVVVFARLVGG